MDVPELLSRDSSRDVAELVVDYIDGNFSRFKEVLDFSIHSPVPISWRGVRAVYICAESYPDFVPLVSADIVSTLQSPIPISVKRGLLRLLMVNVSKDCEEYFGFLLEYCYSIITSAVEEVAVKIYALDVLFQITEHEPDLKNELLMVLEEQMLYESKPAFQSKGKKILKKLKKQLVLL